MRGKTDGTPGRRIIDIHCHILPGIDDGAANISETVKMLRMAAAEGITDIIATPHFRAGRIFPPPDTVYEKLLLAVGAAAAEGIAIKLYPGNEIYYREDLPEMLRSRKILTLNGSEYALVEFSPAAMYETVRNGLDSLLTAGFTPVLAHAERCACLIDDCERAFFLREMGAKIQVNAGSVTGKSGAEPKKFVHRLLRENAVDFIGTDAHGSERRPPEIAACRNLIERKYGEEIAAAATSGNAEKILEKGTGF